MNRETFEDDTIFIGDAGWASWALHPSPWAGGCLIVNCEDDPDTPVVAFAPPGVSLYGESGFETARWRRADWSTTAEFIDHLEPSRMITLELVSVYAEVPPDFSDWLARATAAHIERLRSFLADRPGQGEAAELADLLSEEMDQAFPGAFDSYCSESESFSREEPVAASQFSAGPERMSLRGMTRPQAWDLFGQVAAFGLLYVLYRLVREPSAPQGAKVGWNELLSLPVGEFALWLYGFAGGTPATPQDTMLARGVRPRRCASSREATTSAAAPSTIPLALPAVTKPSLPKAGLSAASPSSVVSGRGWSSASTRTVLRPCGDVDGHDLVLEDAARAAAAAAAFWLRSA